MNTITVNTYEVAKPHGPLTLRIDLTQWYFMKKEGIMLVKKVISRTFLVDFYNVFRSPVD